MKTAFALILALGFQAHAAQKTVCTVTINSSDEKASFKRNLPPGDFKFVELTDYDTTAKGSDRNQSQWLKNACDAGVQCDVLMVSAHFGGFFFGSSGYQITVPALEQRSCNNTCDGILKRPREVFLFGCNTLAEKGKDSRTQQQYIDVLIGDGYRPDVATQVAETRYGAVGSTFKDQMRRVFAGVPHIYGFNSVAPSGMNVGPDLNRYFRSIPDYAQHLDQMAQTTAVNQELQVAMQGTSLTQTTGVGVTRDDAGIPYRHQICAMYDERATIADRTNTIVKMLQSPDRFIFLNSVVSFLNQNITMIQADYWANEALKKVLKDQTTMSEIDRLKSAPSTSLSLRLDLMDLEVKLGRLSRQDFTNQGLALLKPLVHNLTQANADLLCSAMHAHKLQMNVRLEDFADGVLARLPALTAMQCLQTSDERITQTIIPMINDPSVRRDGNSIRSYLLALTHLPGRNEDKIRVANFANTYASVFGPYAYGLLTVAQSGQEQVNAAATLVGLDVNNISLAYSMMRGLPRQEGLGIALLSSLSRAQTKQSYGQQMEVIIRTLPLDSAYWGNVASEIRKSDEQMQAIFMGLVAQAPSIPSAMADTAIRLIAAETRFPTYYAAVLEKANLSADQQINLINIANSNAQSGKAGLIRYALSRQANLSPEVAKYVKGPGIKPICEVQGDILQCRFEKTWIK